jgi:hypothetical protein
VTETTKTVLELCQAFADGVRAVGEWINNHIVVAGAVASASLPVLVIFKVVHLTGEEQAGAQLGIASIVAAWTGQKTTSNVRVGERIDKEVERRTGGRCPIAERETNGAYYCTREPGHEGPCATVLRGQ